MQKRILFCNGNKEFVTCIGEYFHDNHVLALNVQNTCDLIYNIFYTTEVFDAIVIGSDFEVDTDFTEFDELSEITEHYVLNADSKFFSIELGKLCRELSAKKNKKEPKILIMTSYHIEKEVMNNNMSFISTNAQHISEKFSEFFRKIK